MAKRFEVVGINDDEDFCECCGKTGLKRVVWIEDTETDVVKHFGTTCATAPAKGFNLTKEIKEAIDRADRYAKTLNILTHQDYRRAGGKYAPKGDGVTFAAIDPALWQQCRAENVTRGFNY